MPKICQAGITRTYKRKKADSTWPGFREWSDDLPRCGGSVTFSVDITGGGPCHCDEYCYCTGPELNVTSVCTKCSAPYVDGITGTIESNWSACEALARFLNG